MASLENIVSTTTETQQSLLTKIEELRLVLSLLPALGESDNDRAVASAAKLAESRERIVRIGVTLQSFIERLAKVEAELNKK